MYFKLTIYFVFVSVHLEAVLENAIINGANKKKLASLLEHELSKTDLNGRNAQCMTLLQVAVSVNNYEACEFLADAGVDLDAADGVGATALFYAAADDNAKLVNFLVLRGADVNRKERGGKIALHVAAKYGFAEVFKCLLLNTDKNKRSHVSSAYHFAAREGRHEIIEILLCTAWSINIKRNPDNMTPLKLAIAGNHTKSAFMLISVNLSELRTYRSDEISYASRYGRKSALLGLIHALDGVANGNAWLSAVDFPVMYVDEHLLACKNSAEIVKALILDGADMNAVKDGETAMEIARRRGNYPAYLLLCKEMAVRSSRADAEKFLPILHFEITEIEPDVRRIRQLITAENIDEMDYLDRTPVRLAVEFDNAEVVETLIAAKCDLTRKDGRGSSVLHVVKSAKMAEILIEAEPGLTEMPDLEGNLPLQIAIYEERLDMVKVLAPATEHLGHFNHMIRCPLDGAVLTNNAPIAECLLKHGAAEKVVPGYYTPMHLAGFMGRTEMARLFVKYGMETTVPNAGGQMPAHQAVIHGDNEELIKLLMVGVKPDATDMCGYSLVHHAILREGRRNVVKLLVEEYGVPLDLKMFQGKTALHTATRRGHFENAKALIEFGADVTKTTSTGKTAMHIAISNACVVGHHSSLVECVYLMARADRNLLKMETFRGYTPLNYLLKLSFNNALAKQFIAALELTPEDVPRSLLRHYLHYQSPSFNHFLEHQMGPITFVHYIERGLRDFKIDNQLDDDNSTLEDFVSEGFGIFYGFAAAFYPEFVSLKVSETGNLGERRQRKGEECRKAVEAFENSKYKSAYVKELRYMFVESFLNEEGRERIAGTYMSIIPQELVEDAFVLEGNNGDFCGRVELVANALMLILKRREELNEHRLYLRRKMADFHEVILPVKKFFKQ